MGKRTRAVSFAAVAAVAMILSACSSGLSAAPRESPSAESNREASFDSDVELCVAAGPALPGEEALVEFANQSFRWGDRMPLTSDRCMTYGSFVVARIIDAKRGYFIMSISVDANPEKNAPNFFLQCDQYTTTGGNFETRLDWFESWSPPKTCYGNTVEAYRFADSKGTAEFNVNIGF